MSRVLKGPKLLCAILALCVTLRELNVRNNKYASRLVNWCLRVTLEMRGSGANRLKIFQTWYLIEIVMCVFVLFTNLMIND